MAAVLTCGPHGALSHQDAAALLGIGPGAGDRIHVSVPAHVARLPAGIAVHRRAVLRPEDVGRCRGIPVTSPLVTLIDLATCLDRDQLEAAINEADKHDLITPEDLHAALDRMPRLRGKRALRETLERPGFTVTDSELERRMLPIAHRAGLGPPRTREYVHGWRVDFYWPDLGLVVETDGLRYHRTPFQQERDRLRDQAHAVAGLTTLRFTHAQVKFQPNYVEKTLATVGRRLRAGPADVP
jgi:very-short-patch-repair endonuclease